MDLDAFYVLSEQRHVDRLFILIKGNWQEFSNKGHPLMVHLMPEHARRSLEQNRIYWKILQNIAACSWVEGKQYDKNVWHEFMRRRFLPSTDGPEGVTFPTSTTNLSVKEFSEYIDQVCSYAGSELGCEYD